MSAILGTTVAAKVTTGDTVSTYPVADQSEIKGGHHSVADITARDAIPAERREDGMTCHVAAEKHTYELSGGITNSDWINYVPNSRTVKCIITSTDDVPAYDVSYDGILYFKYTAAPPPSTWLNITAPSYVSPPESWYASWDGVKWVNDYDYVMLDGYSGAPFYLSSVEYSISISKIRIEYDFQGREGHLRLTGVNGNSDLLVDIPYTSMTEYVVDPTWKIKNITMYSDTDNTSTLHGIITKIEVLGYVVNAAPIWTNITSPSYITPTYTNNMATPHWETSQWVSDYPYGNDSGVFRFEYNTGTFSCDFMTVSASFNYITTAVDIVDFPVEFYDINDTLLGTVTYSYFAYEWAIDPTWQIKFINFAVPSNNNSGTIYVINARSLVQN
jgi:hypothetical protein